MVKLNSDGVQEARKSRSDPTGTQEGYSGRSSGSRRAGVTTAAAEGGGTANSPLLHRVAELGLGPRYGLSCDWLSLTMPGADGRALAKQLVLLSEGAGPGFRRSQFLTGSGAGKILRKFEPLSKSVDFDGFDYECWEFPGSTAQGQLPLLLPIERSRCSRVDHVWRYECPVELAPRDAFEAHWKAFLGAEAFDKQCEFKGRPQSRATGYVHDSSGQTRCYREDWSPNHAHAYLDPEFSPPSLMRVERQTMGQAARVVWQLMRECPQEALLVQAGWIARIAGIEVDAEWVVSPRVEVLPPERARALRMMFAQYGETLRWAAAAGIDVVALATQIDAKRKPCRMRESRFNRAVEEVRKLGPAFVCAKVLAMS